MYNLTKVSKKERIIVSGLTSGSFGGMEFHNLGNYVITEPLFKNLRAYFPKSRIKTTIQMSDKFYTKFKIEGLKNRRFWYLNSFINLILSTIDIFRILLFKLFKVNLFLESKLLKEINNCDIYLDFSGDIYGDNANSFAFLESNLRLYIAFLLKKKVVMLAGSYGPFKSFWKRYIAKFILNKLNLITCREHFSKEILIGLGVKQEIIYKTACPSILFESRSFNSLPKNEDYYNLTNVTSPLIGIIISGWNMREKPYNKWPRDESEFTNFYKLIEYIIKKTNYKICLMSHQNSTDKNGNLIRGNDHKIIFELLRILKSKTKNGKIFTLQGLYNASESRAIISNFDLLISGRIHGFVQGVSQNIPTLILDYGHPPKAHKIIGFAKEFGIENYVADPNSFLIIEKKIKKFIKDKDKIKNILKKNVPLLKNKSILNFELLRDL